MNTTRHGWNVLHQGRAVLFREYAFRPNAMATTLVFRGTGDGLVVVSPSYGTDLAALDELSSYGEVVALVASNGLHHMGQAEWRARFPRARSFAPASSIARIAKRLPALGAFEPLEALAPLVGDGASVVDAPGFKVGNAFVTVRTDEGSFWYPSDLLANIPRLPPELAFRLLMSLTDSAPDYKLFRLAVWLMVSDKKALRAWAEGEIAKHPRLTVVPAHGPPVVGDDVGARTLAQLARLG